MPISWRSSRHARVGRVARPCPTRLVAEQCADSLDRVEVAALSDGADGAAVDERLVDGEVEALRARLHPGAVERAAAVVRARAAAARALEGVAIRPVLVQEDLNAAVGGGLEHVLPAGRRA